LLVIKYLVLVMFIPRKKMKRTLFDTSFCGTMPFVL